MVRFAEALGESVVAALPAATVHTIRTVSVVIPTYNRSRSLCRLLRALQQSATPAGGMEIVVVDDGSTDATAVVVAESGVRYLFQKNAGPGAARDLGWRSAVGDIIVFLDDDVVPERDAIVKLVDALEEVDGVGAVVLPLDTTSVISHYIHVDAIVDHKVVDGTVQWLITAAAAFRREALERVGGFDNRFRPAGEDVDLSLRLVEAGCSLRVEPSARVRHHHRASFRHLVGMSHRYGKAYRALGSRHAAHRTVRRRSAFLRLSPGEWKRMYAAYRLEAPALRSVLFMALHAIVVIPYAIGVVTGGRLTPAQGFTGNVDLPGRRRLAQAAGDWDNGLIVEVIASELVLFARDVAAPGDESRTTETGMASVSSLAAM